MLIFLWTSVRNKVAFQCSGFDNGVASSCYIGSAKADE